MSFAPGGGGKAIRKKTGPDKRTGGGKEISGVVAGIMQSRLGGNGLKRDCRGKKKGGKNCVGSRY